MIFKEDDRRVLVPVDRSPTLAEVLSRLTPLEEDFPPIDDPPVEWEEIFVILRSSGDGVGDFID